MRRCNRYLRLVLSLLAAALVCVVSRAAHAEAPQCDVRAATTFAPNPTLDSSKDAADVAPDDCSQTAIDRTLQRGHAPNAPDAVDSIPRADVPAALRVLPASPAAVLEHFEGTFMLPAGVKGRVDRPPRG